MKLHAFLKDIQWIQYSPDLAKMFTPQGAILLCWVIWKSRTEGDNVKASFERVCNDTGLSESNIITAREQLGSVLNANYNRTSHEMTYSVNTEALDKAWEDGVVRKDKRGGPRVKGQKVVKEATSKIGSALQDEATSKIGSGQPAKLGQGNQQNWVSSNRPKERYQERYQEHGAASAPALEECTVASLPPEGATGNLPGMTFGDMHKAVSDPAYAAAVLAKADAASSKPEPSVDDAKVVRAPEVPAKAAKTAVAYSHGVAFREAFVARFKARVGVPYVFAGAKDGSAIKRLLGAGYTADSLVALLNRMEAAPDGWAYKACKAGLQNIAIMASRINDIQAELKACRGGAAVSGEARSMPMADWRGKPNQCGGLEMVPRVN